ncbi:hypothetical protein QO002_001721 [Pararhizobium capsulatum DSM 1112]|uniref:DUF1491 family protein n=1 Tax=Pararhizobium capsulatum DSM 1112 TaxID=1121113 RepID=A0ABU0BNT0_9HYPH|nr:DUF1491 family protein [Pararhizobium capsulatum]MDQ0319583.1 hypothetical protein [Pararhizobium capsulatum DSM 1112]
MRLTSEIFVSALIRRVFSAGGYAAVLRKGSSEAGAIFIRQRTRLGAESLYAPAPQSFFVEEGRADDRLFELRVQADDMLQIDGAIEREVRFDPDCWVVELEVDEIGDLLPFARQDR